MGKYKDWKEYFNEKNKYKQDDPHCFYDLEGKYLPEDENAMIIDVGCGKICEFENYHNLWTKYKHLYILDGNKDTIKKLKDRLGYALKVELYNAPAPLHGFGDKSVDFIYCSHIVEHLNFKDVYKLLQEFDRVLKLGGILVIRSPMPWFGFYETFDHIKPYPPLTFTQYLCGLENDSPSYRPISKYYEIKEIAYRYNSFTSNQENKLGSSVILFDFLIQGINRISRKFGIKKYRQTGYTIILKKNNKKNRKNGSE